MLDRPPEMSRTIAISSRDSDACVWTMVRVSAERLATASSRSREHDTANRGANAARSLPSAAPFHRSRSPRLSSIDACAVSRSRAGVPSAAASIMHLPMVARMPLSATASNTASVSCTVSIVSTVVVPLDRSSVVARRTAARSDAGVCAASISHTRVRSQSIS